jgi:hypothetical protein
MPGKCELAHNRAHSFQDGIAFGSHACITNHGLTIRAHPWRDHLVVTVCVSESRR